MRAGDADNFCFGPNEGAQSCDVQFKAVIEGQIELTIDTTPYTLSAGDSFFFKNHLTNSYRNSGAGTARVLWVNTPQVH